MDIKLAVSCPMCGRELRADMSVAIEAAGVTLPDEKGGELVCTIAPDMAPLRTVLAAHKAEHKAWARHEPLVRVLG